MPYAQYRPAGYYTSRMPPGVKWLLILNIAVYVAQFFCINLARRDPFAILALAPWQVLERGYLWQLGTYLFLHGGLTHILFNMFTLWMFGMDLERDWGTRAFLRYYFLCGIGAGLCVVAINLLWGDPYTRTLGSSGAIYGLLLAYGLLYPDRTVLFSFLFPIKAKYFVLIIGAIAFLGSFGAAGSGVSHVAHLGGMLFGYAYLRSRRPARRLAPRVSWTTRLREAWRQWKIRRARRKFEVYLRQHDRHRWPH
ncbi:MAG: rhomboid family intramembrane serine protease [Bryobacteraceae bacterium]